jgi:hypothetical protein
MSARVASHTLCVLLSSTYPFSVEEKKTEIVNQDPKSNEPNACPESDSFFFFFSTSL